MPPAQDLGSLKQAIVEQREDAHSLLFVWLTSEPGTSADYLEVAETLVGADQQSLAHLVAHRGIALFPESDSLSLLALRLALESRPKAAEGLRAA